MAEAKFCLWSRFGFRHFTRSKSRRNRYPSIMGDQPAASHKLPMQIQRLLSQTRYVAAMGSSFLQKLRLFYYAALKPSLAFRRVQNILWIESSPFQSSPRTAELWMSMCGITGLG